MDSLADFNNRTHHAFTEACLIGDFFQERDTADEKNLMAERVDFEDWPWKEKAFNVMIWFGSRDLPYLSASFFNDTQVLFGSTSKCCRGEALLEAVGLEKTCLQTRQQCGNYTTNLKSDDNLQY